MDKEFTNRSNYLVAFLAAVIGLSAFKDNLESVPVLLFGFQTNLLGAFVPLLCAMLLSAYVGALAHFTSSITFTKIPMSGYLSFAANFIAIIGLMYPIVLMALWLIQLTLNTFANDPTLVENIYNISTTITSLLSVVFAALLVKNFNLIKTDNERIAIINSFENAIRH